MGWGTRACGCSAEKIQRGVACPLHGAPASMRPMGEIMPTYSHTYTYNIEVPEVDTTMTTDISLTCTSNELQQINDYLARAQAVVAKRGPFVGEFKELKEIRGRRLPVTSTKGKIVVNRHPLDETPGITSLLSCICSAVPGVGMNGKIYQVNAYFGKRVVYEITKRPHGKAIDVVQRWDAVRPGDTYVPTPKITLSSSSSTSGGNSGTQAKGKTAAPETPLTPADIIAQRLGKQSSTSPIHEEPKLRLVNGSLQGEPDYLMPDDRFDPMALAWLLQAKAIDLRWRFWQGKRTWQLNFNERTERLAPVFFENMRNVYGQALFDVLAWFDSDGFVVPVEWMHEDLVSGQALPIEDYNVATIFALLGTGLWTVSQDAADAYVVRCDERLWRGVPDAPGLIARVLWMLRTFADYRNEFTVSFEPVLNPALDEVVPPITGACFGASEHPQLQTLTVSAKPVPDIFAGAKEHPFDGGYSVYRKRGILTIGQEGYGASLASENLFVRKLLDQIDALPCTATVDGGVFADSEGSERMRLLPGDVLTLVATWNRPIGQIDGDVVGIKAYGVEGTCVGELKEPVELGDIGPTDFGWRELACLLPHVTCVVRSVDKKTASVPLTVELSYDARGLSTRDVLQAAKRLMRDPYELRTRLSRGPHVASDLLLSHDAEGNAVGHLRIPDEPNPAPASLEAPQGTRPQLCENVLAFAGTESQLAPLMDLMRANVLRPVDAISGWYYDQDELDAAATVEETFQALRADFAERLPYVFSRRPSASYYHENHLLTLRREGERLVLCLWFNTYDKPNNDDLAALFKALQASKLPMARVYKRVDKREAHMLLDTFARGKNSFGQMRRKEKVTNLEQMATRRDTLAKQGTKALTDLQLAEWALLDEALGNAAHKVFDPAHPVAETAAPSGRPRHASRYLAANGKADSFAVAHLLASGLVFLDNDDLGWSMGKHTLKGLRIDQSASWLAPSFVSHAKDYAAGIVDLMNTLEANELLRVSRNDLHHSFADALGEGNLTGMALMRLMGWGRALWLVDEHDSELRESLAMQAGVNLALLDAEARKGVYVVACDDRVLRAVPNAYPLIRRLVGALRAYNGLEGPHVEVIVAYHSEEADAYLPSFRGKVSHTLCEPTHVEGKVAQLTDADGDAAGSADAPVDSKR